MSYKIDQHAYIKGLDRWSFYKNYGSIKEAQEMDFKDLSLCLYCRNRSIPYIELIDIRFSDLKE